MKKELTREEAIQEHRKMWTWIAEETLKQKRKVTKEDYFLHFQIKDIPKGNCYLCEYTFQFIEKSDLKFIIHCSFCPVYWASPEITGIPATCSFNAFYRWKEIKDDEFYQEASELAMEIANLPVKPMIKIGKEDLREDMEEMSKFSRKIRKDKIFTKEERDFLKKITKER